MGAEADALWGAGYGERSAERSNQRNGYRHRQFDTRTGSLDLAMPKLRHGPYFPDWPLERRKRAERALTTVVATCYLLGVSTRRMDKLVETLGITSLSKSQVSVMANELDAAVEAFRHHRRVRRASLRPSRARPGRDHCACGHGNSDPIGDVLERSAVQTCISAASGDCALAEWTLPTGNLRRRRLR